jgi:hypothetical protein
MRAATVSPMGTRSGAPLLCAAYGGVYAEPGRILGYWYCDNLRSPADADAFAAEILQFRPAMGSWYCVSRIVAIEYPDKVVCSAASPTSLGRRGHRVSSQLLSGVIEVS